MSKQKAKLKKKKESEKKDSKGKEKEKKLSSKEKVAIKAVQKNLQALNLKGYLLLIGFATGGALLRIPMQAVPSAEPLTFFAILSGWLFGRYKGAAVGASSLYMSNFFMFGGQGPWSLFQAIGFGAAGFMGGFLRKKAGYIEVAITMTIATLIFEIIMNAFTPLMVGSSVLIAFALALPFTVIHLISNLIFSLALPKAKRYVEKKGGFDEKDICNDILAKYNISSKLSWFKGKRKKQ